MDAGTLELVELDVDLHLETGCQHAHAPAGLCPTCSGEVTSIFLMVCEGPRLVCQNAHDWATDCIVRPFGFCGDCARPLSECWSVRPV